MSAVTNSIELIIQRGILPAPNDPYSNDNILESLDLLDATGVALLTEGWSPQIAPLKNGGLWVESAITDGRSLLSDNVGNVIETMQVTCSSSMVENRLAILKKLGRLARMARAFHTTRNQVEPVYLKWVAACGVEKPQYALIYNIDWSINGDTFDANMAWDVTLTIEREPYWRGLWPGANPIEWTLQQQGKTRGITSPNNGYVYTDMVLYANQNHLAYKAISNRQEWGGTAFQFLTPISYNWIDIPAASIPGDAPALLEFMVYMTTPGAEQNYRVLFAKTTNPTGAMIRDAPGVLTIGQTVPAFNIFNAADAGLTGPSVTSDACGVFSNGSTSTRNIVTYTIPISSPFVNDMIRWGLSNGPWKNINYFHGNFAAFLRCKATNGSASDVRIKLIIFNGDSSLTLSEVGIPVLTPAANCRNEWALLYLGSFPMPFDKRMFSAVDGRGKPGGFDSFELELQARNTVGSTRALEFLDLILMPIDEGFSQVTMVEGAGINSTFQSMMYDNTGYTPHGDIEPFAQANDSTPSGLDIYDSPQQITGQPVMLTPGVNNRIYFLFTNLDANGVEYSVAGGEMQVRLNIIPRWSSVRDI